MEGCRGEADCQRKGCSGGRRTAEAVEIEAHWIEEERVMAAARHQAILDAEARCKAEAKEVAAEPEGGSPSKQKERAEGELVICNRCATRGADDE